MTNSEFRGKIEDFLYDLEKFQQDNIDPEIDFICEGIVSDLNTLDEMLSKQEDDDE